MKNLNSKKVTIVAVESCTNTFKIGQHIEIMYGPLAGLTGRLIEFKGKSRMVIALTSLEQKLMVEIPFSDLSVDQAYKGFHNSSFDFA